MRPSSVTLDLLEDGPAFAVPPELSATGPPEARALARDEVRLLVAEPNGLHHVLFRDIGRFLRAGDLLVVNTSATVASAIDGVREDGRRVIVHFSGARDDGSWIVELRVPDASGPADGAVGERVLLVAGASLVLMRPHPSSSRRCWCTQASPRSRRGRRLRPSVSV